MAQGGRPEPFRILFVCTGNICRSPFAHLHTRALLDVRLGPGWAPWFTTASAGTGAVVGSAMHPETRALFGSRAAHADVEAFRARQLPARDVRLADLVLTASRRHRSTVLELEPRALRTTFTMREFARLVGAVDPRALPPDPLARARALVPAACDQRGVLPPVPAEDDAIPDPISGGENDHAEATRMIDAAVRVLVDAIAAGLPPRSVPPGPPRGPTAWTPPPGWHSPTPDGGSGGPGASGHGAVTSGSLHLGPIRRGAALPDAVAEPEPARESSGR